MGCVLVQLYDEGWDTHGVGPGQVGWMLVYRHKCSSIDQSMTALLTDF